MGRGVMGAVKRMKCRRSGEGDLMNEGTRPAVVAYNRKTGLTSTETAGGRVSADGLFQLSEALPLRAKVMAYNLTERYTGA